MSSNPIDLATYRIDGIEISSQKELRGTLMITWLAHGFYIALERFQDLQAAMPTSELVGSKQHYGVKDLGHAIHFTLFPGQVIRMRVKDDQLGHPYVTRLLAYDSEGTHDFAPDPQRADIPGYMISRV